MAMVAADMAKKVADALKDAGYFNLETSPGQKEFNQQSYDATLEGLKVTCGAQIEYIQENMEVTSKLTVGLNSAFSAGVPVPMDGGLSIQTAQKVFTSPTTNPQVDVAKSTEVK